MPDAPPILSTHLRESLDEALRQVPVDKKGRATVAITTRGVEGEVGYKPKSWLDLSGYAGRDWNAGGGFKSGWTAGARVGLSWK